MFRIVMVLGVISIALSVNRFARLFLGLEHLDGDQIVPMIVGGIAGGIGAWYFVPWLLKREAMKNRAAK